MAAPADDRLDDAAHGPGRRVLFGVVAMGCVGSVALVVAAWGTRLAPLPDRAWADAVLRPIAADRLSTVVLYAGLAGLAVAWLRLGQVVRSGGLAVRGVLRIVGVWLLPLAVSPPLLSGDVYSYLASGVLSAHGINPYHSGVAAVPSVFDSNVSAIWQHTPTPYGPLFVLLTRGVVGLTGQHDLTAIVLMRGVIALPGLAGRGWALPILARHLGGDGPTAVWLAMANPVTLAYLTGGPHNDLLMTGCLAAGLALIVRRHPVAGYLLIAVAAAIKAPALIVLPFAIWIHSGRSTARGAVIACGALLAVFTVTTVAAGVDAGWIHAITVDATATSTLSLSTGLGTVLSRLVAADPHTLVAICRDIAALTALVVAALLWWRSRHDGRAAVRQAGVALLAVVLLAPSLYPWYFLAPLVLCAGLPLRDAVLRRLGVVILLCTVCTLPDGDGAGAPLLLAAFPICVWAVRRWCPVPPIPVRASLSPARAWGALGVFPLLTVDQLCAAPGHDEDADPGGHRAQRLQYQGHGSGSQLFPEERETGRRRHQGVRRADDGIHRGEQSGCLHGALAEQKPRWADDQDRIQGPVPKGFEPAEHELVGDQFGQHGVEPEQDPGGEGEAEPGEQPRGDDRRDHGGDHDDAEPDEQPQGGGLVERPAR
jgi:alpha-1,6-mannosyltransferase